jgi:hypothetical protein
MPSLAAVGDTVWVIWEDQRDGYRDLYLLRSPDRGHAWEPELRVDSDPAGEGISYHPQVVVAGGALLVTWWDERSGQADVYVRRSADGGRSWDGPEVRLDPGEPGAGQSRDVAVAAAGERVTVVWEEGGGRGGAAIVGRSSTDGGATWAELVRYGGGQSPRVAERPDGPACVGWAAPVGRGPTERTSVAGRIVDIPVPVELNLASGPPLGSGAPRVRTQPGMEAHESLWMAGGEGGVFVARAGVAGGRGAVETLWTGGPEAGGPNDRWRSMAVLQFGGALISTATDVRARDLTGAAGPDGAVHLVWVASYGAAADLGYARLRR